MSNVLLIYNQLRAAGISHAGALGLMGNWMAESGLEACRLQNDFSATRTLSHAYTADVTAGRITRTQFARDQKGYGLAQWTYFNFSTGEGRKLNLYDFWKKSGKALDDVSIETAFAGVGAWLGYFLGGNDGLLYALLVFVVVDYITENTRKNDS